MNDLVVVAIPEQRSEIWKFSSEKVPHLSLLYLGKGDNVDTQNLASVLKHYVDTMLGPIRMEVKSRGVLGKDSADVLFLSKHTYSNEDLDAFRDALKKDPAFRDLYNSVEQFPEWTPHVTLGYPETPAKIAVGNDIPYSISFDRIALWTGDSEGPEIVLSHPFEAEVAMSDIVTDVLEHYGVKGMRWGVRRERSAVSVSTKTSRAGKTKIKTSGGAAQPASDDAKSAAKTKQKLKTSGVDTLSNKELQELAQRMNLEQQVNRLSANDTSAGKKLVKSLLGNVGKQQANKAANNLAAQQIDQMLKTR